MAWNLVQDADGSARLVADGGGSHATDVTIEFATGVEAEIGRGTADTDITYIALRAADGSKRYLTLTNANATAVSATRP
jgi:hypothetical protein